LYRENEERKRRVREKKNGVSHNPGLPFTCEFLANSAPVFDPQLEFSWSVAKN
jgi:hypothetical protein